MRDNRTISNVAEIMDILIKSRYEHFSLMVFLAVFHTTITSPTTQPSIALATGSQGHIIGEIVPETAIFWGIPYAQAPVNNLRWRSPRPPLPYKTKYWNATYARPGCPQTCSTLRKKYVCPSKTSENCLFLNIWIPRRILKKTRKNSIIKQNHYVVNGKFTKGDDNALAVIVYIHGGNFKIGAGSALLYDSRFLAKRGDVIVVTINYRLSALGFLVQGSSKTFNYGILDQIQALKWVKKNIQKFGGNPNKIAAVGQSAGAESIGILLTSDYGKGLFNRAIMESNPWSVPFRSLPEARRLGNKLAKKVGCKPGNMTCLRNIPSSRIIHAGNIVGAFSFLSSGKALYAFQPWGPVIDKNLISELPLYAFIKGNFHKMPMIMGTDKNDGLLFVLLAIKKKLGMLMYDLIVGYIAGNTATPVVQKYPPCLLCDNRYRLAALATDYAFFCPMRKVLFHSGFDTWSYIFNATLPFKGIYKSDICTREVCHGAEVPYIFDTVQLSNFTFNARERSLAHKMQYYWTNFAKYGSPNVPAWDDTEKKAEYWMRFRSLPDTYSEMMMSKQGNTMLINPHQAICDFWDSIHAYGKY